MKHLAILLSLLTLPAFALSVEVDGKALPPRPAPVMENGRVLVPMRAVFQALGAEVEYKNGVITARRDRRTIVLRPQRRTALINGQPAPLDTPAKLTHGTTYVPLRFVAQALKETVDWDPVARRVRVGEAPARRTPRASRPLDLKRLVVGNQGGVLKVWDKTRDQVAYFRGIDDRSVAPLSSRDQAAILAEFALNGRVDQTARDLMDGYNSLPKRETLALLGVFNSLDGTQEIQPQTARQVRAFLVKTMRGDRQVVNRRQAVLALAVGNGLEDSVTRAVLDFYSASENLWETFPVQQFFEYQAARLKASPNYPELRRRALSVNSLYRENIASYL